MRTGGHAQNECVALRRIRKGGKHISKLHGNACSLNQIMTPPCKHEGCKERASFGLEGERWTRCVAHRTPYMVTKRCKIPLCFEMAEFKFIGGFSSRCAAHNMNPDLPPLPPIVSFRRLTTKSIK